MDDLIAFLRARLDEDQAAAEAALKRTTTTRRMIRGEWVEGTVQPPEWRRSAWPPARVLAEVEAKRRILTYAEQRAAIDLGEDDDDWENVQGTTLETILRFLALPYADHPDYRPESHP